MVTLLVITKFIPYMLCLALVTMLWYLAIHKNVDLNDIHFLLLASSKSGPQLSIFNSLTKHLPCPWSERMLMYVENQGKGLHEGFIDF